MILLRLTQVVNDVTIEVEGEANSFDDIQDTWESFTEAREMMTPSPYRPLAPGQKKIIEVP